jgi:hypothetical protein
MGVGGEIGREVLLLLLLLLLLPSVRSVRF